MGNIVICSDEGKNEEGGKDMDVIGSVVSNAGVSTSTVVGSDRLLFSLGRRFVSLRRALGVGEPVKVNGGGDWVVMERIEDSEASGLSINLGGSLPRRAGGQLLNSSA